MSDSSSSSSRLLNNNDQNNNSGLNQEMFKLGLSKGTDYINQRSDQLKPVFSNAFLSLKIYFAVSNQYVLLKLSKLLYPAPHKIWSRVAKDEDFETVDESNNDLSSKYKLPKDDVNAPDLYIPLMAFFTYILLFGLQKGLVSVFKPDDLIQAIWRCCLLHICECLIIKGGLNLMQVSLPFLDIVSYTGYKYVGLSLYVISCFFGHTFGIFTSLYTSIMLSYYFLKTLAAVVPIQAGNIEGLSTPPRHLLLVGFSLLQLIISLFLAFLTPTF